MDVNYDEPHRLLSVDLSKKDALDILSGRPISESTRRKVGKNVTVRFVPASRQRFDPSIPIGDSRHFDALEPRFVDDPRADTSRVHIRGSSVQIWMLKATLATNAFANEVITDTITRRQNPIDIQRVHISLPDLEGEVLPTLQHDEVVSLDVPLSEE